MPGDPGPAAAKQRRRTASRQGSGTEADNAASPVGIDGPASSQDAGPSASIEIGTRVGFLVHDVSRMRRTLYDQAVKPLGLTRAQWWVLAQLSRQTAPDGMPQTELARLLDIGKVTIGGLVDRLEERGFVERRADRDDRRAKRVFVTAVGRKTLRRMAQLSSDLNAVIFEGFDDAELEAVERLLGRMKGSIRSALDERERTA